MEVMAEALAYIFSPWGVICLLLGIGVAMVVGPLPGLGGTTGMVLVLPFVIQLPPEAGILVFIGIAAVLHTSDTVTSVLFGVPGTGGSMATIVDGYPMARKGEGARALAAGFTASLIGGIVGAVFLLATVPVMHQLLQIMRSPELLMMALMGLTMVSVLTKGAPLIGLALAALGLLMGQVGLHWSTGIGRWTFAQLYFETGVPLLPVLLGVFGFAEITNLVMQGSTISVMGQEVGKGRWQGVKDVFHHWWLALRCSAIGVWIGIIPGVGSSIVDWLAYGHAVQTEKHGESFGTGDVRGVIAPETSNNAKAGAALLPTLAFGVPGSQSMVVMLAAFTMMGIVPGPRLFTEMPHFIFVIIWGLALANIVGCLLCFALTPLLAKICKIPPCILGPVVMMFFFIGAQTATTTMMDVYLLVFFGIFGYILKRLEIPRVPFAMGFILGNIVERYLTISDAAYGAAWLMRPGVIAIGLLTIAGVVYSTRGKKTSKGEQR
ncbi:tripartite tricarboxylate transporter permease [Chloroflexota bacterium]